jgi:hypothetical protein
VTIDVEPIRDVIERGADQLGWELDKLLQMTLQAMAASEDEINAQMEALREKYCRQGSFIKWFDSIDDAFWGEIRYNPLRFFDLRATDQIVLHTYSM